MEEIEKNLREAGSNGSFYEEYSRAAAILLEYKDVVIHVYNSRNRDIITNYLEKMTAEVVRSYIAAKSEGENISEKDLEFMLYDMDYSNPDEIQPMFFRAVMRKGVLDLRNCEVIR